MEEINKEELKDYKKHFQIKNYKIQIANKYATRITYFLCFLEEHLNVKEDEYEYPFEFMYNKELKKGQFAIFINEEITHVEFSDATSLLSSVDVLIETLNLKENKANKINMKSLYMDNFKNER